MRYIHDIHDAFPFKTFQGYFSPLLIPLPLLSSPTSTVPTDPNESFPEFRKALSLHMVETSDNLRALQVKALGATFAPTASYSASRGGGGGGGAKEVAGSPMQLPGGGEAVWHTAIEQVGKSSELQQSLCWPPANAVRFGRRRIACAVHTLRGDRRVEIAWCGLRDVLLLDGVAAAIGGDSGVKDRRGESHDTHPPLTLHGGILSEPLLRHFSVLFGDAVACTCTCKCTHSGRRQSLSSQIWHYNTNMPNS